MNVPAFLSVFTPSHTAPEDLESIFVQRQTMLADAIERVNESATTGNKHHLLFIGPRGIGKTHLVSLLVHRLSQNVEIKGQLHIAWLNEDETSTTLLEFLQRIYLALIKRYPDDYNEISLDAIYDLDLDAAERRLSRILLENLKDRVLLIVVENLDTLFEGLGELGQQRLRAFIQEHPVLSIIATAQRLGDHITKRKSVFFGFFQIELLEALSMQEATELLINIASLNQQTEVVAFLRSPKGRSRIRALHHLSGGNHRIYIVLSQFINHDNIDALVIPFTKMGDEMTPYYQERIRWLPPQQRKIVEYLCTCNRPVPVKDLARRLFATPQTISSQLKALREKGYVMSVQRGRESLYEIAEPLMRLCVEIKENQSHEPMRLLVDFLRAWYDERSLTSQLQNCENSGLSLSYLQAAIDTNVVFGNLRTQLLMEWVRTDPGHENSVNWVSRIEAYAHDSEELALACGEWAKGHIDEALLLLDDIADERRGQSTSIRASACLLSSEIHIEQGAFELAINAITHIQNIAGAPIDDIAVGLYRRGCIHAKLGDYEKAIADYSAVIEMPGAPVWNVGCALTNRGNINDELGDREKAIADYSAAIDLPDAPVDAVWRALCNRALIYKHLDRKKLFADLSALIDLPGTPEDVVWQVLNNRGCIHLENGHLEFAIDDFSTIIVIGKLGAPNRPMEKALLNRGLAYEVLGEFEKAIADLSAFIELPDGPADLISEAFYIRGLAYKELGDHEKAVADFSAAIDLPNAATEWMAKALYTRGLVQSYLGDNEKEIADYSAVISLPNAPADPVARAFNNRGIVFGKLRNYEKSISDYSAAIDLPDAPVDAVWRAHSNRGWIYYLIMNDVEKAEQDFEAILQLAKAPVESKVGAHINLTEIRIATGRWDYALSTLATGLTLVSTSQNVPTGFPVPSITLHRNTTAQVPASKHGDANKDKDTAKFGALDMCYFDGIISTFFDSNLTPSIRRDRTVQLTQIFQDHNALLPLGEALIRHLGSLYRATDGLPASDNLELWALDWEEASRNLLLFRIPIRILRTGINFLKSGGKDSGILLDLNQGERRILEQALALPNSFNV